MQTLTKIQKPIIFIGTGRSGTTIISEIITRHPDLAFPSNYQDIKPSVSITNLVRIFFDNPLWRIHGQKPQLNKVPLINKYTFRPSEAYKMWEYLSGNNVDFSRGFLLDDDISDERIALIRQYFNKMVLYQNKNRLAIKITGPSRITFLSKIFPDAVFIHLKRDLIPTINSFLKVSFWQERGAKKLWWLGAYTKDEEKWALKNSNNPVLMTAFQLNKIIEVTLQEKEKFSPQYLEIRYEDFVANPLKEIKRVISFTGLSSFNFENQLNKIKIHNRNKKDSDYFDEQQLIHIYQIIRKNKY